MRGKVIIEGLAKKTPRITPAYAGKSRNMLNHFRLDWDHPRLCGEKFLCGFFDVSAQGSPPPMRGKVALFLMLIYSMRITPAYAGKRIAASIHCTACRDHPRLCGEKVTGGTNPCSTTGSPPPMRGKGCHK